MSEATLQQKRRKNNGKSMLNSEQILRKISKLNNNHSADKKLASFFIPCMPLRQ